MRGIPRRVYLPRVRDRKAGTREREKEKAYLGGSKKAQSAAQGAKARPAPPREFYAGRPRAQFELCRPTGERRGGRSPLEELYPPDTKAPQKEGPPAAQVHSRNGAREKRRAVSSPYHDKRRYRPGRARASLGPRVCKLPPLAVHGERPRRARALYHEIPGRL